MSNKFTHRLTLHIDMNISQLLTPETIPGIKSYLGVKDGDDLIKAVATDQYSRIERLLSAKGYYVEGASFEPLLVDPIKNIDDIEQNNVRVDDEKPIEHEEQGAQDVPQATETGPIYSVDVNWFIADKLLAMQDQLKKGKCVINDVTINPAYSDKIMNAKDLRRAANLSEDVNIEFDELDQGQLFVVTYVDKDEKMKFQVVTEKDMEEQHEN